MLSSYSLGLTFAFIVALLSACYSLVARKAMKNVKDTTIWAITYQIFGGIVYIIPAIIFFKAPSHSNPYYFLIGASLLWGLYMIMSWASYRHTFVSVRQTLNASKNIFVIIFAYLLLGEAITYNKVIGAGVIIFGIFVLSYKNWIWNDKGTLLTLGSSVSQGAARTLDKFAISFFSTPLYAAIQFFLPALWVSLTQKELFSRIKNLIKSSFKWLIIATLIGAISSFFQFESYRLIDVGIAVMIMELGTVLATLGGIIFLKERENILQKILGSIIVFIGIVVLVI